MRCCGLVLIAACSPGARAQPDAAVVADASPDAAPYCDKVDLAPIAVSGTTPGGTLDGFHFASARFSSNCYPDGWAIILWYDDAPDCSRTVTLRIPFQNGGVTSPGSNPAEAIVDGNYTNNVTFEATTLDADALHIAGRFVSHDPAWTFDVPVDMHADNITRSCTI